MSYILDALRKSEAERRQGQAPDLGQSVQMVHKPRKKPVSVAIWLPLLLVLNAGVLGYVFWPELRAGFGNAATEWVVTESAPPTSESATDPEPLSRASDALPAQEPEAPIDAPAKTARPDSQVDVVSEEQEPTIIVPRPVNPTGELTVTQPQGRVPHLVELPLSFQKSIPDLTFNSHIVSSNPLASSVMINNQYLRVGDRLGSIMVERINDDSVVFSQDGQAFRIGTTRNWMSPR